MTFKTRVSSRFQVAAALTVGVYLIMACRSHFVQMLEHSDRTGRGRAYSTTNVAYQAAYAAVQVPAMVYGNRADPALVLAAVPLGMAVTSAAVPYALSADPSSSAASVVNGALTGAW